MMSDKLEELLFESESEALDFKVEQYPFAGATEDGKSELLKDILGFANAWRRSEAFILIGVREVPEGKSVVVGVDKHLQDHSLQQFVNSKTNRPMQFSYEIIVFEGLSVGIITIQQQQRPFWITKNYGKLKKDEVYVRRGSSTDLTRPASPDEIIKMTQVGAPQAASLEVQFHDPMNSRPLGKSLQLESRFIQFPLEDELPRLSPPNAHRAPFGLANLASMLRETNTEYYKQAAIYCHRHNNFQPIQLGVMNSGEVEDVRLEIRLPTSQDMEMLKEWEMDVNFPQKDHDRMHLLSASGALAAAHIQPLNKDGVLVITRDSDPPMLEVEYRKIQPGRTMLTEIFYVARCQSGTVALAGRVFSKVSLYRNHAPSQPV